LEAGVFRSDLPTHFRISSEAAQEVNNSYWNWRN
jgi:hypothetical protein